MDMGRVDAKPRFPPGDIQTNRPRRNTPPQKFIRPTFARRLFRPTRTVTRYFTCP